MSETAKLPPKASKLRSILRLQKFVSNPIPLLMENVERHGDTYCFSLRANKVGILTVNPTIIQHVLHRNATNFLKPVLQRGALGRFVGKGLLLSSGEYHTKQRKLVQPNFHRKKLSALVLKVNEEIERYFSELDEVIAKDNNVELNQDMKDLTFRVMANSIFSTSLTQNTKKEFSDNFHVLQKFFSAIVKMPYLLPLYNVMGKSKKHLKLADDTNEFVAGMIDARNGDTESYDDLCSMLMSSEYEDGSRMKTDQVREEIIALFLAGHETAGNVITWIHYILNKNPDAAEKILAEVQALSGDRIPTFDELLKMEYLMKVIFEGLRIYPPSWITDRVAMEDDEIEGFFIPKGALVIPFIYGVHHQENIWPDHMKFDPERFTKENVRARHNFAHMPFGAGPRMCIGRNFAIIVMQMTIIKFLRKYKMTLASKSQVAILPGVTLGMKDGMNVIIERRNQA